MSRYIDAVTLKVSILRYAEKLISHKRLPITKKVAEEVINDVCFAIDVQESQDVVPVVRCKDCRYMDDAVKNFGWDGTCNFGGKQESTMCNRFCSDGERREVTV